MKIPVENTGNTSKATYFYPNKVWKTTVPATWEIVLPKLSGIELNQNKQSNLVLQIYQELTKNEILSPNRTNKIKYLQ